MRTGSAGMLRWLLKMFRSTEAQSENKNGRHGVVEYTRPATWEDLLQVARLMNKYKVRYVLVGGYALAAHGYARMTQDIDIAVSPDEENAERWIKALSELPDGAALELKGKKTRLKVISCMPYVLTMSLPLMYCQVCQGYRFLSLKNIR